MRRRIVGGLLACEVLLAALHIVVTWAPRGFFPRGVWTLVHLDREANLPTWFSSAQLLLLGLALAGVAWIEARARPRHSWAWLAGAAAAVFLSADEAASIHELLGTLLGQAIESAPAGSLLAYLGGFPGYYWLLLYAPLALPAGLIAGRFMWRELGPFRGLALAGLCVFAVGAAGLDFLEGALGTAEHGPVAMGGVDLDLFLVEELMEMVGVTLVLSAILGHAGRGWQGDRS